MTEAPSLSPTAVKFGYPATCIAETPHWMVLLRPQQVTLGSLVLLCREPVTAFGDVSAAALAALNPVLKNIERLLGGMVSYQRINYLMLMMVDPDVHFHVIPRYDGVRSFQAVTITDAGWPGPPRLDQALSLSAEEQQALCQALRAGWGAL